MFSGLRTRSTTFRVSLAFMAALALGFLVFGVFVYLLATSYLYRDLTASIEPGGAEMIRLFQAEGVEALAADVEARIARSPDGESVFVLVDRACRPVTGTLNLWPAAELLDPPCRVLFDDAQWFNFEMDSRARVFPDRLVLARFVALTEEYGLVYGRVANELDVIDDILQVSVPVGFLLMLAIGVAGSTVMSRIVGKRLERLNRTSRRIRRGDLSSRVPIDQANDEFDRLALNLNEMMDQIEVLMAGVKHVSNAIAHDLRSPLTRLHNNLEELRALLPREANLDSYIDESIEEAGRMLGTFNALLRIAQIEAGARRRDFEQVDLAHVTMDVVEFYWPVAAEKGVTLHSQTVALGAFLGDQDLLSQAMSNLVDNAVKYTPPGGTVTVGLENGEHGPRFFVSDTGPGIPESERENVFERFHRLEAHRDFEGSGLGLSLVVAIAKLHGGVVELQSNRPGLKVSVEFPA